ncbi:hypothetical protein NMY3_02379 [Candidatus Nitrosocosmicus oleophilus]|uniref:Uncharacterized protein n=1 Tax=Candidatus Nitrosocosmicus oleophilus TaxID=1353260 RepID=A0A654LZC9_9ARCH|nr:hypothetical protein NMY3_02379 [Candidatus Nitrosocosmicus oleophilus]
MTVQRAYSLIPIEFELIPSIVVQRIPESLFVMLPMVKL